MNGLVWFEIPKNSHKQLPSENWLYVVSREKLHEKLDKITEHKILLLALINFQSLILNVRTFTLITKMVTNDVKDSKSRDAVSIIPFTVFAISSLWLYL